MQPDERSSRIKINLIALSTAALLTVYAAGYARTRSAAERFAGQDAEGRPDVPGRQPASLGDTNQPDVPTTLAVPAPSAAPVPRVRKPVAESRPAAAVARAIDSAVPTVAITVIPDSVPVRDTSRPPISAQAPDSAAQASAKPKAQWRDGIYTGWGTSRHGDIEAAVEIKDGRIIAASISQCLTRYSCSWIDRLPGQVVARQAADVDLVSGATQSTNAFYHAIVEALSKAK